MVAFNESDVTRRNFDFLFAEATEFPSAFVFQWAGNMLSAITSPSDMPIDQKTALSGFLWHANASLTAWKE
ncbi:MAG TPA: hypothetical protein VFK88_00245 [Gallionella sp.]|nr:hypothetical protein [Gallionella sp.]